MRRRFARLQAHHDPYAPEPEILRGPKTKSRTEVRLKKNDAVAAVQISR